MLLVIYEMCPSEHEAQFLEDHKYAVSDSGE